MHEKYLNK